jgi:hypothetical protein
MDESDAGLLQQVDQLDHVDPGLILQLYHSQEGLKNKNKTSLEQVWSLNLKKGCRLWLSLCDIVIVKHW